MSGHGEGALDPDVAVLIAELNRIAADLDGGSADEMRASFERLMDFLAAEGSGPPYDGSIDDLELPGPGGALPARRWTPDGGGDGAVLFLHGGGWVLGDLGSAAPSARRIAERLHCTVVAIDYRLAPEHPWPAAFDDALAALRLLRASTSGWLGVAGDSAGGGLAAAVALAARDEGLRLDGQLLLYPALAVEGREPSRSAYADGYLLTGSAMQQYWDAYRGSADPRHPTLAPLHAPSLRGVAPAVVVTAEFDLLRDEGTAYAQRLIEAGVPVTLLPVPGLVHGFVDQVARVPRAGRAFDSALGVFSGTVTLHLEHEGGGPSSGPGGPASSSGRVGPSGAAP